MHNHWKKSAAHGAAAILIAALAACATASPPKLQGVGALADCAPGAPCANPLPVRAVLVTMFEIGADEGDAPGEFQLWKERRNFSQRIPFPHAFHDLYYDPDAQILAMVTGIGTARSASATMALGMDPRFDLTKAYWLVAGIAGIDPEDASIGSAVWSSYLVDGDLAHEIDAREKPADWPTGYFPRYAKRPYDPNKPEPTGEMYRTNEALMEWAYALTKDMTLPDLEGLAETRNLYTDHPMAQQPQGDSMNRA